MHEPSTAIAISPRENHDHKTRTALMVGRSARGSEAMLRQSHSSVVACISARFDGALLDRVKPSTIAFPLISDRFDATQIVARLARLGYDGDAMIISPRLPSRSMVLRELRAMAPGLSIELVEAES